MKKIVRIIAVLMLLFNGIGALYGGMSLITDPTGDRLKLSGSFLEHTPFDSYLIPGIILFCVNGIFSFVALASVLFKLKKEAIFVLAQGILLSGWIIVQIILIQYFYAPLQGTLLAVGIILTLCGLYLKKHQQ